MKRLIRAAVAVLLAWLGLAAVPAVAQNTYPYQAPAYGAGWQTPLSPYLRMLLPGNTAVNYYSLVQPQFQQRQFRNQTNQTIQGLLNQIPPPPGITEEDVNRPMNATGHPTVFNYTGSYFSTLTGQPFVGEGTSMQQGRMGAAGGAMRPGGRPSAMMGMRGSGVTGMGGGIWPNMRSGMFGR
ncbi:MAG: hypothetical protein ACRELG_20685 [Gemmataceae bacterium]